MDKEKLNLLIKEVLEHGDMFYEIIKQQYPSENYLDLTQAEQFMLEWFSQLDVRYRHLIDLLDIESEQFN